MTDSTVQEKNITFPTDAKLYRKIIDRVLKYPGVSISYFAGPIPAK